MRAEIIGIPPVPTGLTWASGTIEFAFDPNWSDGAGRGPGTITGILQPTTKDKFVVPGSLGALFVPATPTGTGVIRGPLMAMRWQLTDSQGREYRVDSVFPDSLLADGSNQFNVNALGAVPTYVTSAGPAPVGVDLATGDARYVRFTTVATTAGTGVTSLATNTEAIAGTDAAKAIVSSSLKAVLDSRFSVASVAALQAVTAVQRTAGFLVANVVAAGLLRFDAASTRVTDGVFVVRPNDIAADATPGRWLLVASDILAVAPAAPIITRIAGVAPNPVLVTGATTQRTFNTVGFTLEYDVTNATAGLGAYTMTPPAGWGVQAFAFGASNNATSIPQLSNLVGAGTMQISFATIATHRIYVITTLVKLP